MKVNKQKIESFIRDGVNKGETDQKMAIRLGVGTTTIAQWRKRFEIEPANKFPVHFRKEYGPDALESLRSLVERKATLREIANFFGFSRENARLVKNKLRG